LKTRFIYFLYRLLLTGASPFLVLYFLLRYGRTTSERLGRLPASFQQTASGAIWLHAVSVGEVLVAAALIGHLKREIPEAPVFVSITTAAGRRLAAARLAGLADGIFAAPIDLAWVVRRVLRTLRPSAVVVLETEIWPNLFRESRRAGCALAVVNARISDRALPRYRRWRWFFRSVLEAPHAILAQSESLAARYREIGAPAARAGGNLKYDFRPAAPAPEVVEFVRRLSPSGVFVAASTMPPDEEETVIRAFGELARSHPRLLMLLAPRKPERFDLAARLLEEAGLPYARRSALPPSLPLPGVLLLDTMGELAGLFSLADVVFVGGSLVTWGGHNLLEPAVFSKPIVSGPHTQNFREMADAFRRAGALVEVRDADSLAAAVDRLLRDPQDYGARAKACAEAERGAAAAAAAEIRRLYDASLPRFRPPLWWALWLPRQAWFLAGRLKRATTKPARLDGRVISVGNLSMGGAGKTPLVRWLAHRLPGAVVLTRGYKTGDEARMLAKDGIAVAAGADRLAAGRRVHAGTYLLDDGFQHARLARDADVVVIDSLDPFPYLRLREPLDALARADVFVITRAARAKPGIEAALRRYNPAAPVFYSRVVPLCWVEGVSGREAPLDAFAGRRVRAFCGLAQPASFARSCGLRPVLFPDHHAYTAREVEKLLQGVEAALTTEKDWMNLDKLKPERVWWLKIELRFDRESELLEALRSSSPAGSLRDPASRT
jgi:tetraacyldisaccharide 4'-kinase